MRQRICLVLAAALAAVVSETERRPNNCTDLIDGNGPVDLEAVTVGGVARELWLVWTSDADRVAAALLLRVLGALKRCQKQRCRLRLCYVPQGLCDLLAKKGTDVVGIETAITVGFETDSGCPTKRFFNSVSKASQLQSREAPAECAEPHQPRGLQPAEPLYLATELDLTYHAPWLKRAMENYVPNSSVLCALLRTESERAQSSPAAIQAVDQWTVTEPDVFREMVIKAEGILHAETYQALVYRCDGNETGHWTEPGFDAALQMFGSAIQYETQPKLVVVRFPTYLINCSSPSDIVDDLQKQLEVKSAYRLLGALGAGAGVPKAAALAASRGIVFMSYDTQPRDNDTPSTAPDAAATGAALRALLARCGWRRAVLLSEATPAASSAAEAFGSEMQVGQMTLPASDAVLKDALVALSEAGQRVFVLNADGVAAARTLAVAVDAGLTSSKGYAWMAREWTSPLPPPLALLALAPTPHDGEWLETVSKLWPKRPPPRAAPLLSAMRMLALGYAKVFERHETWRFDHRLAPVRKSFLQIVHPVEHKLTLEVWLPNETEPRLDGGTCPRFAADVLDDASYCRLLVGNPFHLTCLDWVVYCAVLAVLLGLVLVGYCALTARRRAVGRAAARARDLRSEILVQLLERQPGTHARLKDSLVHRERVTLLRELGAGRHGRVSLAALAPGDTRVAAKMPHEGCAPAEEGELIREAATLAPLRHRHVVRLLGVCLGPGQPLLLTPVAPHGDLLRYLRARRPPAQASEAGHVSAAALTRLAREAALALAYLHHCGVVHCDVRAANCLVDERRELKLADFGMARPLSRAGAAVGAAGGSQHAAGDEYYACRRRALFPVLWMAPESLARGAFSAASDVWALGVLSLELVTLGARPFGALGAAEAVAIVSRGGHARLPSRATAETRDLTRQCWRHSARERPSARELAAWLASHPVALAPVPPTGRADHHNDATAFGEAPCESTFSSENSPAPS